jgi:hypothetical protein
MKQIIKIIGVFTFLFCTQSCKKDFLKPKPLSFFAPENVYVNKAGFEAGLVTVRANLLNDFYGNLSPVNADLNCTDIGSTQYLANWTLVTPSLGNDFPILPMLGRIYGYIKNTNIIISRIDNIEWVSQEERNAILAEAYFYRSYWYYRMVHTYGDVPFSGEELTGAKLDYFTHSKWTILKKIQTDLEFAAQWLPEAGPKYRPSKYAALHLLAKVYLVNLEFDKAIEAATTVINGPYALMQQRFGTSANDPDRDLMWDLHRPENKDLPQNTEAILILIDRAEAPPGAKTGGTYTMRNYAPAWWHSRVKDSQGRQGTITKFPDGTNTPELNTLGYGDPDFVSDPWFNYDIWNDGIYTWENTPDLRRSDPNWIDAREIKYNNPASVDYGKPLDPKNFDHPADSLPAMFPFPFYKVYFPMEPGFSGLHVMGGNGDYYVFRLAETYLIRAEAYFWKGQPGLAASDINVVRQRAHALPITVGDATLDYIFDERARELYIEEHRRTELVRASYILARLNKEGYSMANFSTKNWFFDRTMSRNQFLQIGVITRWTFKMQPYNVLWPIDINVITANTQGVINQNEGYEGAQNNVPPLETIE